MSNQKEVEKQALKNEILRHYPALSEDSLSERELTLAEVKAMPAREYYWHSIYNSKNVELALSEQSRKAAGQEQAQKNRVRDFWDLSDTNKRTERANEIGQIGLQFEKLFPQFVSVEENTAQLLTFIKAQGETVSVETLSRAYQNLCAQGLIWVTPENCGLEGSEAIRGKVLTSRPDFYKMLEPVKILSDSEKEQQRIAKLSAAEWEKEHPRQAVMTQFEIYRRKSVVSDFEKRHPEFDANPDCWQILMDWYEEYKETSEGRGVQFGIPMLELAFIQCYSKLAEGDFFWSEAPSKPVSYGITTITDHRKPHIPEIERNVEIRELETPKRFSLNEILSWDSQTMVKMMQLYPELEKQIDNM